MKSLSRVQLLATPWTATYQAPLSMGFAREIRVQSPGWKDPLENKMSTHSSLLVWETPWIEQHGGLQSMGSQKSKTLLSD